MTVNSYWNLLGLNHTRLANGTHESNCIPLQPEHDNRQANRLSSFYAPEMKRNENVLEFVAEFNISALDVLELDIYATYAKLTQI